MNLANFHKHRGNPVGSRTSTGGYKVVTDSADDRGTWYSDKQNVSAGDVYQFGGQINGRGKVHYLFYDNSSSTRPFSSGVVSGGGGDFSELVTVPAGNGQIRMRVDFRLWDTVDRSTLENLTVELAEMIAPVELVDFPEEIEKGDFMLQWNAAENAIRYSVFMRAGEDGEWAQLGNTEELYFEMRLEEIGQYCFRVDAVGERDTAAGDVHCLTAKEVSLPVPPVAAPSTVAFSGYKSGAILHLWIANAGLEDDPFWGISDPEARPLPVTGYLAGRDGQLHVHSLEASESAAVEE